jgi:hypothetical protein
VVKGSEIYMEIDIRSKEYQFFFFFLVFFFLEAEEGSDLMSEEFASGSESERVGALSELVDSEGLGRAADEEGGGVLIFFSSSAFTFAWAARMFSSIASFACDTAALGAAAGGGFACAAGTAGVDPRILSSPGFGANGRPAAISAATSKEKWGGRAETLLNEYCRCPLFHEKSAR